MPNFHYEGTVLPDIVPLTLDYRPRILRREAESSPDAEFEVTVFLGKVRILVETETVNDDVAHDLFMPAWDVARTLVETAGYIAAIPYNVVIERAVLPGGEVMHLALGDRSMAATHSFEMSELERVSDLFLLDMAAAAALSDLLMTLGKSNYSPIACGRVADSIARLIMPEGERRDAWAALRNALRVDEAYVKLLTKTSMAPRHGQREYVPAELNGEIARRAWTLMSRYLRFRLDGELSEADFPLLIG